MPKAVIALLILEIKLVVHLIVVHEVVVHPVADIVPNVLFELRNLVGIHAPVLERSPDQLQLALMPLMFLDDLVDAIYALRLGPRDLALFRCGGYLLALGFEGLDLLLELVDHTTEKLAGLDLGLLLGVQFRCC